MSQYKKNNTENEEIIDFNIKDFIRICLNKWYWFAICMAFAVGIALFYIYRKQPEYKRYEQILVNDQDSSGGVGEISNAFSTLGLFSKNSNVYNELLTITSPAVLYEVADSLQLYMNYAKKDGLRMQTLYGTNLPFRIDMLDIDSQQSASFRLKLEPDGTMEADRFIKIEGGEVQKFKDLIKIPATATMIESPIGKIRISENPRYVPDDKKESMDISINKMAMQTTADIYGLKLKGDLADDDADVIELSIEDVSVERAVDILNYILIIYNQNWIEDKNKMAKATSAFIDERLAVISAELGEVDQSIAGYMKSTGSPDLIESTKANMERGSRMENELVGLNNDLSMALYMQEFLADENNANSILPINLGSKAGELSAQIVAYNELLMDRDNIINSSSVSNPLVANYNRQLQQMRNAIRQTVASQIKGLKASIANIQKEIGSIKNYTANVPEVNLPLLAEERQQEIKQNLYLFLLQKKEENELTRKFSADNIRVITPPVGPLNPVSPKKGLIVIVALILGFGVPFVILYYLETTNNKVNSKKDLETIMMPFAGEIPQVGKKMKTSFKGKLPFKVNKKEKEEAPITVVSEGKRDVVNEAFRVVRGNLDFMAGKDKSCQVVMLTSFNPGSGKSFIAYNLALSYGLKNKKVLLIDCDLRHGSSSMYVGMPSKGLTGYLSEETNDWQMLLKKSSDNANVEVLPIGKMPPNPAELLENGRLQILLEEARKDYDVIFLDCPPVNIVVDTQIVGEWADRTLFIVRAGLLEKSAVKELNEFYEEKKFKNLSVILNGTEAVYSRYYTYGNYQNLS